MSKFLRETWLLFLAHARNSLRGPIWLFVNMFQPICYLLLFAPLLENLTQVPGFPAGGAYNVFAPGLLVMTAFFSAGMVGFNLVFSLRSGVVERWRVTPVSRLALTLSMVLRDVLTLLAQCAFLVVGATLLGMRPDPLGLLLLAPLLVLLGMTMSAFSYSLALIVKDPGGLASSTNLITIPALLLSGITLPLSLAPAIIQDIGRVNPFAYAVDAGRALVNGRLDDASILPAFAIFIVLTALMLFWVTSSMRKATA